MIVNFRDRGTRRLFFGERVPAFQSFANQARSRLDDLDHAIVLMDLTRRQGNRLEALSGAREGQYSIRINRQWRISFAGKMTARAMSK